MESLIDKILHFLAMFGVAILVLFAAGFWLFYTLKKAASEEDQRESESKSD